MGAGKSKAVVTEKSARAVVNQTKEAFKQNMGPESLLPPERPQLDPEVLKEISKWATVRTKTMTGKAGSNSSGSSNLQPTMAPAPPSASLIRMEEEKKYEAVWNEKKHIDGRLSESQLLEVLNQLRKGISKNTEENESVLNKLSQEYKISKSELTLLNAYFKFPNIVTSNDQEHQKIAV